MKKIIVLLLGIFCVTYSFAQNGEKKPASPPAKVSETINSGAVVSIDYSQPSVKGRTIGKDLEPMDGKVWRAGANKATVFEVDKDVTIDGKPLPAGKYSFFALKNGEEWTLIFNKTWEQWGTDYEKSKENDALKINVKGKKAPKFAETLTYTIKKDGKVSLWWGNHEVSFQVK